jgi:ankyrin repeat protein
MSNAAQLFEAIASADTEGVRAHLSADPSLASARDSEGRSAILLAAYHRNAEMVEMIREHLSGMDIFEASALGDLSRVREVVGGEREGVDAVSPDGFGPLGLAAFFGHVELVDYLLELGCDPDRASANDFKVAPLHSAVANADAEVSLAIAQRLLDGGANPDVRQAGGWTPIHSAAAHGRLPLTRLLLERGADSAPVSEDGRTPAEMAEENGHAEIVKLLA